MKKAKKFTALLITLAMLSGFTAVSAEESDMPSSTEDYVASTQIPANLIQNSTSYNAYASIGTYKDGNYTYAQYDYISDPTYLTFTRTTGTATSWNPHGTEIKSHSKTPDSKYTLSKDFESGKNYVISAKVRLTDAKYSGTNVNANYAESTSTADSVPFGMGIGKEGNPVVSASLARQDVTSSDWQEFKHVITAPKFESGESENYHLLLGLMNDFTTVGGGVALDVANGLYIAEEEAHDISLTADSEIIVSGINHTVNAKASLLNQLGIEYKGDNGTFKWYALNADKSAVTNDIVITPSEDTKTAAVTVAEGVTAGDYTVLVESVDKSWVKSMPITVKAVPEEHIAGERTATMHKGTVTSNGATNKDGTTATSTQTGTVMLYERTSDTLNKISMHTMHGHAINLDSEFIKDNSYVLEVWAKNAAPDVAETVQLGAMVEYNHVAHDEVVWNITDGQYKKYTAVLKPTYRNTSVLEIGIPETYLTTGAKVEFDFGKTSEHPLYVAAEQKYDISVETPNGKSMFVGNSITAKASIINQVGTEYTGDDSTTFSWLAMNEDKTAMANGITITPSADGKTAKISASDDTEPGKYSIVAISNDDGAWAKTTKITVMTTDDTVTGDKPANLIQNSKSGNAFDSCGAGAEKYTNVRYLTSGSDNRYEYIRQTKYTNTSSHNPFGNIVKYKADNAYKLKETLKPNTNYVVSAYLRLSDSSKTGTYSGSTVNEVGSKATSVPFGIGIAKDGTAAETASLARWDVTGTELKEYKAVIKSPETFVNNNAESYVIDIGLMNDFNTDGGAVVMELSNGLYIAEETAYDISNTVTGKEYIVPGGTTTLNAKILNQIGLEYTANQNITWYAMNEDCTAVANEITVTETSGGNVSVKASDKAAYGKYTIIAAAGDYGITKKAVISVVDSVDERISKLEFNRLGTQIVAEVEVKDTDKSKINFVLGEFNEKKLVSIDVKTVTVENGAASTRLTLNNTAADNTIKAFVWDENMAPVANVYNYTTEIKGGSLSDLYGEEAAIAMFNAPSVCEFYNNKDAAVSITFDDGILDAAKFYNGYL